MRHKSSNDLEEGTLKVMDQSEALHEVNLDSKELDVEIGGDAMHDVVNIEVQGIPSKLTSQTSTSKKLDPSQSSINRVRS